MRRTLPLSLLLVSMFVPAVAGAQTDPTTPTAEATAAPPSGDPLAKENWPLSGVDRPLGLSAGMLQLDVNGLMNMSKDLVGKPLKLPLAAWYGISNELQAGIITTGLCLSGEENGCLKVFDDLSFQILFSLFGRGSSFEVATWAQFNFVSFDRGDDTLQIGGAFNWVTGGGNVALLAYPNVGLGITKRDELNNKESFGIPVSAFFRATPNLTPVVFTGLGQTLLDGFGDAYAIPVGVGVLYAFNAMLDAGVRFDLPYLIGNQPGDAGAADLRALTLWVSVRPL
jgi:hypothetical protein